MRWLGLLVGAVQLVGSFVLDLVFGRKPLSRRGKMVRTIVLLAAVVVFFMWFIALVMGATPAVQAANSCGCGCDARAYCQGVEEKYERLQEQRRAEQRTDDRQEELLQRLELDREREEIDLEQEMNRAYRRYDNDD